jgi:hypothetical protein
VLWIPGAFLEPEGARELVLCREMDRVVTIVTVRVNASGKAQTVEVSDVHHDQPKKREFISIHLYAI